MEEAAATAMAGAGARVVPSGHDLFAFGPAATVVILDLTVAASALASVDHAELGGPFPPEFTAVLKDRSPIELFLRLERGCLHLGRAYPSRFGYQGDARDASDCDLQLMHPLPFDV